MATLLLALLAWPARAQTLSRGPYIVAASSVSAQICWRYQASDGCHVFDSLAPGATFTYTFGGGGSQVWAGRTLPISTSTLTFVAFGSLGSDAALDERLAKVIAGQQPQLVAVLGDVVYPEGEDKDYDARYFKPFGALLTGIPFYSVAGDRDYGNYSTAKRGAKRFLAYAAAQHKSAYYSFDAGPAHFTVLDTNSAFYVPAAPEIFDAGSEQLRWLEDDLKSSSAPWKIVLMHVPVLTTTRYNGENGYLRHALMPLFRRYGVALVLQGHDLAYERSRPVDGTVYVNAGTGGAGLDKKQELSPDWLEKRVASYGVVAVKLDSDTLALSFIDDQGGARDAYQVVRSTMAATQAR